MLDRRTALRAAGVTAAAVAVPTAFTGSVAARRSWLKAKKSKPSATQTSRVKQSNSATVSGTDSGSVSIRQSNRSKQFPGGNCKSTSSTTVNGVTEKTTSTDCKTNQENTYP
ncbi:hypothetical protein BBD46_04320 [Natrialba sp. SSL1]|nr:hypothetical protein BBD46_04320 [Natrialba sp. SSL1]